MPIRTIDVDGLVGLLETTIQITRALPDNSFLWFRGIGNSDYELVPSIMRDGKTSEQIFEREKRLLTRFRQRSLAYWAAGYPQTDWEHLFAMQHLGMPTRLLDWTENLFVAAHFALAASSQPNHNPDSAPAIWCLDPVAWNRATPVLSEFGPSIQVLTTSDDELDSYRPETTKKRNKTPVAIYGSHNSSRIVAQRGTFMVWGNDVHSLESFAVELSAELIKLSIRGDRFQLRSDLLRLGFGETMVFPELPSLARELATQEGWR